MRPFAQLITLSLAIAPSAFGQTNDPGSVIPAPRPVIGEPRPRPAATDNAAMERARLMNQLQETLRRLEERMSTPPIERPGTAPKTRPTTPDPQPPRKFDLPEVLNSGDGTRIGMNLFRAEDFDGAFRAFRAIDTTRLSPEDRAYVQYMTATCLRRLNRRSEAASILRDVAEAKDDEFLAECALSQLGLIRSAQELEAQLEQLRSRPKPK